jgi:hypothetical protein
VNRAAEALALALALTLALTFAMAYPALRGELPPPPRVIFFDIIRFSEAEDEAKAGAEAGTAPPEVVAAVGAPEVVAVEVVDGNSQLGRTDEGLDRECLGAGA